MMKSWKKGREGVNSPVPNVMKHFWDVLKLDIRP